jgi:hypothetical protein
MERLKSREVDGVFYQYLRIINASSEHRFLCLNTGGRGKVLRKMLPRALAFDAWETFSHTSLAKHGGEKYYVKCCLVPSRLTPGRHFPTLHWEFWRNIFPYILIISRTKAAGRFKLGTHLCLASSYRFVLFEVFLCSVTGVTSSTLFAPAMARDTSHQELPGPDYAD